MSPGGQNLQSGERTPDLHLLVLVGLSWIDVENLTVVEVSFH